MPARLATYSLQIDHIISEKQRGPTISENLALSCKPCNANKGASVVRYYYDSGEVVLLFNPRKDKWTDHFRMESSGRVIGLSKTGLATIDVLDLNAAPRIQFRKDFIVAFGAIQP